MGRRREIPAPSLHAERSAPLIVVGGERDFDTGENDGDTPAKLYNGHGSAPSEYVFSGVLTDHLSHVGVIHTVPREGMDVLGKTILVSAERENKITVVSLALGRRSVFRSAIIVEGEHPELFENWSIEEVGSDFTMPSIEGMHDQRVYDQDIDYRDWMTGPEIAAYATNAYSQLLTHTPILGQGQIGKHLL